MQTGIDPKVDYAFKRVFAGSECQDILPNLLNAVLMRSGAERLTKIEVLNPFSQKETAQDKQIILDVKARDKKRPRVPDRNADGRTAVFSRTVAVLLGQGLLTANGRGRSMGRAAAGHRDLFHQ